MTIKILLKFPKTTHLKGKYQQTSRPKKKGTPIYSTIKIHQGKYDKNKFTAIRLRQWKVAGVRQNVAQWLI